MALLTCSSIGGAKFLGCSVVDFSASAGWGAQSSEVTINIVEDCEEVFSVPTIGEPRYFEMGNFNFTGLVQSWNAKAGSDGNPIFSVKLISPQPILEHAQVILDHYEGPVPFYNIVNVYGFLESLNGNCYNPKINGTWFGAPAGGFGTANKTERGIPWVLIKRAVQALTGRVAGGYSSFCSGLAFKGANYILDLSSIPDANNHYRIAGPVVSLSNLIDQVCQDGGMDYYVTLLPSLTNTYIIKIVTISRKEEPAIGWSSVGSQTLGDIGNFIDSNNVINKSMGIELRSEVNSAMIIGGKVKQYYQCVRTDGMTPFWGWDAEGNLIKAKHIKADNGVLAWQVTLDCRKINLALNSPLPNFTKVGENELRASLGDYTSFLANILNANNDGSELQKYYKETLKLTDVEPKGKNRKDPAAAIDHKVWLDFNDKSGETSSEEVRDAKGVFNWLKSYSSDFYGKQFLVYFSLDSVICRSQDAYTEQEIYTDIVSPDGAWPSIAGAPFGSYSDAVEILGITNPSEAADQFKDESGKVQPMVKFVGNSTDLNTEGLNVDDYIIDDQGGEEGQFAIWMKATVDDKWVKGSPVTNIPLRCALIKLNSPLIDGKNDLPANFANRPIDVFKANGPLGMNPIVEKESESTAPPQRNNLDGQGESVASLGPALKTDPVGIGVPLQSTTICYGPWNIVGANPGSVQVEIDDGLAPWEYGGLTYMEAAGQAKVQEMATHQQQAERGEITVPGLPEKALATNINLSDAGNESTYTVEIGGTPVNFPIYNYAAQQSSAVISNISTSVGAGGVTTTYTINSFTPVFGRFSKGNAERLKQIGLNRLKGEREMRARRALQNLLRASENRNLAQIVVEDIGKEHAPKSPAIWFAGKLNASDTKRKIVLAPTKMTMPFYNEREGAKTSVMTMDGFFRPVQTAEGNADDLPKVVEDLGTCGGASPAQSSGPPPPVEGQTPLAINTKFLDFLADKDHRTDLFDDRTAGSSDGLGHDIEGVARGTTADAMWDGESPGRLIMHTGTDAHDFMADYRFMALRGPLMIHGWGYDLHGKPIPNAAEGATAPAFKTNYEGLQDKFKVDWLEDATTWPVAPVDLRFDRRRGVWTVPSAFRLYQVETSGDISAGAMGNAVVIKYKEDILKPDGEKVNDPKIQIENWTEATIKSGTQALAYYDTADCKYWIIPPASGASGTGSGINIGATGCGNDIECTELGTGCLVFGSGLYGAWNGTVGKSDFTVSGPQIGQSGNCALPDVAYESFTQIEISSGLKLEETDSDECKYKITGPTITWTGCPDPDEDFATYPMYNLMIGSGIRFFNDPSEGNVCESRIEGPRIGQNEYGCGGVDGAYPLLPFEELLFGANLQLDKTGECEYVLDSCTFVGATGCDNDIECSGLTGCLVFGSGLYGEWINDKTDFLVTGPSVGYSGGYCGEDIPAEPFDQLMFTSGLRANKASDLEGKCSWVIGGPTIQESGCEDHQPPQALANLIIGSGITFMDEYDGLDNCNILIEGPKINAYMCGNENNAQPFTKITFTSGMRVAKDTDDPAAYCDYLVSGPTIQKGGCGTPANPTALANLIIGTGLSFNDTGNCNIVIGGPTLGANSSSYELDPNLEFGAKTLRAFEKLIIGSGLKLSREVDECIYHLDARPSAQIGNDACGGDAVSCTDFTGCLTFGSGLKLDFSDGGGTVTGPTISGNPFYELLAGDGVNFVRNECEYTINASGGGGGSGINVGAKGCPDDIPCSGLGTGCLVFGDGLKGAWGGTPGESDFTVTGPTINGSPFYTLLAGSGVEFEAGEEDCTYTINASGAGCGGLTTGLELVTKVCCSGSNFAVYRKKFIFDSGCLMEVQTPTVDSQHCDE